MWDTGYGPVSLFDATGLFLRRRPIDFGRVMDAVGPGRWTEWLTPLEDGTFVAHVQGPGGTDRGPPPSPPRRRGRVEYLRLDGSYTAHSFGWWGDIEHMLVEVAPERLPGVEIPVIPHFMVSSHIVGGEQVFVSNGDQDEIHQFSQEGSVMRIIRRSTTPIPITEKDREAMIKLHIAKSGFLGVDGTTEHDGETISETIPEALHPRDFHPYVNALRIDSEGHL